MKGYPMKRNLTFEQLEAKKLLAANVSLFDGELLIEGTDQADRIVVSQKRSSISVSVDGAKESFDGNLVRSIRFLGRDGDDYFANKTKLPSVAYGNSGNDTLIGGSNADRFHGGPDDDHLTGNDGDDQLHGDWGDDRLVGGNGDDDLRGWYGDDYLSGDDGDDYLSGYKGADEIHGGNGDDLIKGHEGDDLLYGDGGNDSIYGWKGDDLILGGKGNDVLSAWSGDDIVVGGDGEDVLEGHSGRDLLIGGRGADKLNGGSGDDFVITGYTKFDGEPGRLDEIMSEWNTDRSTEARLESLKPFIYSSRLKYHDGQADQIFDNRDELDLFVYDRYDVFIDI